MSNITLSIGASAIHQHNGLYSLNDLHKASGKTDKHKPVYFFRSETTKALLAELKGEDSAPFIETRYGRYGGTYVCKELVYAYAMWISAAFMLKVIRVFDEQQQKLRRPEIEYERLSPEQKQRIKNLVGQQVQKTGRTYQAVYGELFNRFGPNNLESQKAEDFPAMVAWLEGEHIPASRPRVMSQGDIEVYFRDGNLNAGKYLLKRISEIMAERGVFLPAPDTSPEESIKAWFGPNGHSFDREFLYRLGQTCMSRIMDSYRYYKGVAHGNPVRLTL